MKNKKLSYCFLAPGHYCERRVLGTSLLDAMRRYMAMTAGTEHSSYRNRVPVVPVRIYDPENLDVLRVVYWDRRARRFAGFKPWRVKIPMRWEVTVDFFRRVPRKIVAAKSLEEALPELRHFALEANKQEVPPVVRTCRRSAPGGRIFARIRCLTHDVSGMDMIEPIPR